MILENHQKCSRSTRIGVHDETEWVFTFHQNRCSRWARICTLIVNLDNDAANDLLAFSKKYLKAQVRIIDGEGKRIIENDIVIQTPLSTTFHVMALESKNEALNSKKSILSTMGKCGEIKSK